MTPPRPTPRKRDHPDPPTPSHQPFPDWMYRHPATPPVNDREADLTDPQPDNHSDLYPYHD